MSKQRILKKSRASLVAPSGDPSSQLSSHIPYSTQRCLSEKSSYKFLEECTYKVDLQKLYQVKSTCYFNIDMPYCPVLVRVADDLLEINGRFRYLLQVWNDENVKVFERQLNSEVTVWNIFYNFFVYKPSYPDEGHEYYHIVDLDKCSAGEPPKQVRVKDFTNGDKTWRYVAYTNGLLYVATYSKIKVVKIDESDFDADDDHPFEPDESQISLIENSGYKIHGFYVNSTMKPTFVENRDVQKTQILIALETDTDNQIDLNTLHLLTEPGSEVFDSVLKQFRPMVPRKSSGFDPVLKYQLIFNEDQKSVAVALRKSGRVDFYFNGMLCMSHNKDKDGEVFAHDVELSFDEVFVKTTNIKEDLDSSAPVIRAISHELESRMSISESREMTEYKIENVFYQRIKSHCKIFKGFVFLKTYIFVAHGRVLSLYDIKERKFTKHMEFAEDIQQVFRAQASNYGDEEFDVCVLLESGKIKFINPRNQISKEKNEEIYEEDSSLEVNIEGKILQFDQDRDDNAWTFILVDLGNDQFLLQCLHDQKLYSIQELFTDHKGVPIQLTEETNFVFFFSPKDVTEVMIHQGEWFYVYEIDFDEEKGEPKITSLECRKNIWVDKSFEEKDREEGPLVERELHSAIRVKEDSGLMILADDEYFHVIDMKNHDHDPQRFEQRCAGLFVSDNNYMYTLTHKNPANGIQSGFRLYDIDNCISKALKKDTHQSDQRKGGEEDDFYQALMNKEAAAQDDFMSYHLQSVQVGCQGLIDFSHQNQRLVYQSSYDNIDVVPVLHRNTIAFVGMSNRDQYLATKVINDRFIALNKQSQLASWDIVTGKLIQKEWSLVDATGQDYSEFEIYTFNKNHTAYHQSWAQRVLLMSKNPVPEKIDENQFYDPSMTKANMANQVSYIKRLDKEFHEFKLVEITGEKSVVEHFSFVFPYYKGHLQHMFFNESKDYMLEILLNARAFLYKKVNNRDKEHPNRVKWELVHRFTQFPIDLLSCTQYPYIFSPDFSMYLDADRKGKVFLIKDSFTQQVHLKIPQHIMDCHTESLQDVAARFTWLDNKTIKVINSEGIERKISIDKGEFKEIEFNVIPLFHQLREQGSHYYFENPNLTVKDTLQRLQIKYQQLKSAYLMEGKRENQLYPILFTVDYDVDEFKGRYVADLSFTFLHWNLMEKMENGKITTDKIDQNQFEKLIYNILPRCETVFHRLYKQGNLLSNVFLVCHPNKEKKPIAPISLHMPFLANFAGNSPMDMLCDDNVNDFRTANLYLQNLAAYGIDHHSRLLVRQLPLLVEKELPNITTYINSRLQQTKDCLLLTKGNLKESVDPPGVVAASYCLSNEHETIIERAQIESDLNLQYFDVPVIHQYSSPLCNKFFEALAETDDMGLFESKGIKMLIEYRWPLAREFVVKRLFLPFVFFLFTFVVYMGQVYEWRELDGFIYQLSNRIFMGILVAQSVYFLGVEGYQLFTNGVSYFSSVWNYLDLIPPILLLTFIPLAMNGTFDQINGVKQNQTLEASLQATMSLLLWLKFLYFLRIFKSTGYLIKIIIAVCVDMRHFLLILFLTIMAFGDSMRAISTSNHPQHVFIGSWWQSFTYVYRMILGDFNTDPTILEGGPILLDGEEDKYTDPNNGFGVIAPYFTWTVFYLCTVLNMIIMLNLLIAIISESFSRINQLKEQASYQEKCDIIAENTYLIPKSRCLSFCPENRYLLIATDIQQELEGQSRDSAFLLRETARKIGEATTNMERRVLEEVDRLRIKNDDNVNRRMDKIIQDNENIILMLNTVLDPDFAKKQAKK